MFTIDWQFSSGRGLSSASFDEIADPAPYDEAYPTLAEPVATFIARYLASRETVLILQGPPGTERRDWCHDAFVIEDADHLLKARSRGNVDLHRFLAVADGVVRAQGRKIIFTTNLPNIGDIDEALVRPGRCFATVRTRALERREAASLLVRIAAARISEMSRRVLWRCQRICAR
jgi:hypothetical protein